MKDNFRPTSLDSFVGQKSAVASLNILVCSARRRNETMDHVLFTGPAGLGKTSLASVLANEMCTKIHTVNATNIKTKQEMVDLLTSLESGHILFLDEIHALNPRVAEVLYTAMEDSFLDLVARGESQRVYLAPFTLIGATTVSGMVSRPLLDRFGEVIEMLPYENEEMRQIILNNLLSMGFIVEDEAVDAMVSMSRGVPRIANRIINRVRDLAVVNGFDIIMLEDVKRMAGILGIDRMGLDRTARSYLRILEASSGPIGLATICNYVNEDQDTIVNNVEPYLMRLGFVQKSVKGRLLTRAGREYYQSVT